LLLLLLTVDVGVRGVKRGPAVGGKLEGGGMIGRQIT